MESNSDILGQAMRQSNLQPACSSQKHDDVDELLNALMSTATPITSAATKHVQQAERKGSAASSAAVTSEKGTKKTRKRKNCELLQKETVELPQSSTTSAPCRSTVSKVIDFSFADQLQEAGCRRVMLEEAMALAAKVLEAMSIRMCRTVKLEQNASVFQTLCTRQLVLEKLRCELVTRNLCPVTLHSLCSVFSTVYFAQSVWLAF